MTAVSISPQRNGVVVWLYYHSHVWLLRILDRYIIVKPILCSGLGIQVAAQRKLAAGLLKRL